MIDLFYVVCRCVNCPLPTDWARDPGGDPALAVVVLDAVVRVGEVAVGRGADEVPWVQGHGVGLTGAPVAVAVAAHNLCNI